MTLPLFLEYTCNVVHFLITTAEFPQNVNIICSLQKSQHNVKSTLNLGNSALDAKLFRIDMSRHV